MPAVCKFKFPEGSDRESIETRLAVAIKATESVYGQPRVRIGAGYLFSEDQTELAIDVSTDVGQHIAQVFTGLLVWQLGEDAFTVERVGAVT